MASMDTDANPAAEETPKRRTMPIQYEDGDVPPSKGDGSLPALKRSTTATSSNGSSSSASGVSLAKRIKMAVNSGLEDDEDLGGAPPPPADFDQYEMDEDAKHANDLAKGGAESWRRPPLQPINPLLDSVAFQNFDADYYVDYPKDARGPSPVIRMYGVTEAGNSVMAHIHRFIPYFYVTCWSGFTREDSDLFAQCLNSALQDGRNKITHAVVGVEVLTDLQPIWGYQIPEVNKEPIKFLKISMAIPALVATARRVLEKGITFGHRGYRPLNTYESNLPFVLRYMVDKEIVGAGWVELPKGKYTVRVDKLKHSHCQLEVDINWDALISHPPTGSWLKMAPVRILSFDIECAGRKDHFPEPEIDPVIQIANLLTLQGETKPIAKNIFTLNTCSNIVGSQVISHKTEAELLLDWKNFLIQSDPDIITGFNVVNFDLPYLLNRAKALKVDKFPFLGRLRTQQTTMKDATFSSKAYGTSTNKDISIDGRVQFDLLMVIRREYKLRSYTLNAVSAHFLKQQKEDVHHSIIADLQNGNAETRRRLAVYCLKDAVLPMRLLDKLLLLVNYIEMARVTGVPVTYLLTRGQQIKVVSQLYRKARQRKLVIPVREKQMSDEKYEGATVIEPKRAYYSDPIATLDFASLYPSIMMAHNLCYSTLLSRSDVSKLKDDQYTRTPNGDYFVKSSVRKGVLPEILEELIAARSAAKKEMAAASSSFLKNVLNGRQLALKISANSVYGFTGAQVGQLPCLEISSSVTSFGREMIETTKRLVEEKFTVENGYKHTATVIYGDTDSVMVKFGVSTVKEAMELGREAANHVSKTFIKPIKLEFEKVYYPYLLMNKKRYAGLYWTNENKWDKMDAKGLEIVRRDNCGLVANVVREALKQILVNRNVEAGIEYAKGVIADLLCNRLDLSLLVISKALGKAEDYKAKVAHVVLAERMRARDPLSAPKTGDRVPYVIIKASKGAPAYERAEDPIYVLENDIPIDTQYYVDNQLKQPLTRIFEPILGESKISSLFAGDHTRQIKISTPATGGIMKFAVKKRACAGCKVPLAPNEKVVCKHCKLKEAELYMKQIEKIRSHEVLFSKVWAQCQRCQGSLHQDVLCTSRDCPIFYRRKKVQKDLKEAQVGLDQFKF